MPAVMEAINQMSTEEKLQAMDYLWEQLESSNEGFTPPAWHAKELEHREALYRAGKVPTYDWEEVKERLTARCNAL